MTRRRGCCFTSRALQLVVLLAVTTPGFTQQADTNVITAAEDAFGLVIGVESLGLYSEDNIRGFNPLTAGNARLDGLYFDKQGPITSRLVNDRRMRVGSSALGFPWPAPTGIVDYSLRRATDDASLGSILYVGPFDVLGVDLDGTVQLGGGAGITAGVAYRDDELIPDQTRQITGVGLVPEWQPTQSLHVQTFWGRRDVSHSKTLPTLYVSNGSLPPRIDVRYFGQDWAESENSAEHYGALAKAALLEDWTLRLGVFRSEWDVTQSYADLYLDVGPDNRARHVFVAEPANGSASTSGELRLSRVVDMGSIEHIFHAGVRTRHVRARYGGSGEVDLGEAFVGEVQRVPRPDFSFGAQTSDRVTQWTSGLAYDLNIHRQFQLAIGIQKASYRRTVAQPGLARARSSDDPWLQNASFAWSASKSFALFGAFARGLEDSGVAPPSATNRGEILGAARTSQEDVGIRYALTDKLNVVSILFNVRKPYFNFDSTGSFVKVAEEQHRGLEVSAAGELVDGLSLVAGAMFMSPRVTDVASGVEGIGKEPVGQTDRVLQLSMDYRFRTLPSLSVDATFINHGDRLASADGRLKVGASSTLDIGARYEFTLGRSPATLRVLVANVTDTFSWYVVDTNGFQPFEPRRLLAYLSLRLL